jgi:hypothetical protein
MPQKTALHVFNKIVVLRREFCHSEVAFFAVSKSISQLAGFQARIVLIFTGL